MKSPIRQIANELVELDGTELNRMLAHLELLNDYNFSVPMEVYRRMIMMLQIAVLSAIDRQTEAEKQVAKFFENRNRPIA